MKTTVITNKGITMNTKKLVIIVSMLLIGLSSQNTFTWHGRYYRRGGWGWGLGLGLGYGYPYYGGYYGYPYYSGYYPSGAVRRARRYRRAARRDRRAARRDREIARAERRRAEEIARRRTVNE